MRCVLSVAWKRRLWLSLLLLAVGTVLPAWECVVLAQSSPSMFTVWGLFRQSIPSLGEAWWTQYMVVTNTTSNTISGPVAVCIFDPNGPDNLINRTGVTIQGYAYIIIQQTDLAPGASSAMCYLRFNVPIGLGWNGNGKLALHRSIFHHPSAFTGPLSGAEHYLAALRRRYEL